MDKKNKIYKPIPYGSGNTTEKKVKTEQEEKKNVQDKENKIEQSQQQASDNEEDNSPEQSIIAMFQNAKKMSEDSQTRQKIMDLINGTYIADFIGKNEYLQINDFQFGITKLNNVPFVSFIRKVDDEKKYQCLQIMLFYDSKKKIYQTSKYYAVYFKRQPDESLSEILLKYQK